MALARDFWLVVRRLRRSPAYTVTVVLILAVVLAANAAMFSAVDVTLLNPVPARDPSRLVVAWASDPAKNVSVVELSFRTFEHWTTSSRTLAQAAAFSSSSWPVILRRGDDLERLSSSGVSASFFETLGARPLLGRTFVTTDDQPNASPVAVLSHRLWVNRFGSSPDVIGTTIQLEQPHRVVGVMPEGFEFPFSVDLWTPVVPVLARSSAQWKIDALSDVGVLYVLGRLRDDVSSTEAAAELEQRARTEAQATGRVATAVALTPLVEFVLGPARQGIWALFATVGLLLVIACANVSGLFLARMAARRREFGIQLALGASYARLMWPCWLEAAALSMIGGGIGLLMAFGVLKAIKNRAPETISRLASASIDGDVAVFTLLVVLASTILCSLWPLWDARTVAPGEVMKQGTEAAGRKFSARMRSVLLTTQIGLAVVLLVAAGLVIRSIANLGRVDFGFVPAHILTANVSSRIAPPALMNRWYQQVMERIAELPGVEDAGAIFLPPLRLGAIGSDSWILLEGQPDTPQMRERNPTVNYQVASPGYFTTMRIPLHRGRPFTSQDNVESPRVVLVSNSSAEQLWPGENPIGKRILMPSQNTSAPQPVWRTVIGVVGDVRYRGLNEVRLDIYDAASQVALAADTLVIRTTGNPVAVAASVRAVIRALDPRAVVDRVDTLENLVARAIEPWTFSVWVFTVFAAIGSGLAALGLFSLVALDVVQRRREFALRIAIGAQPLAVLRAAFLRIGRSVVLGMVVGLLIAFAGARAIQGMLFNVSALDPGTYLAVVVLVVGIVTAAVYVPVRRAMAVDPLLLLKAE